MPIGKWNPNDEGRGTNGAIISKSKKLKDISSHIWTEDEIDEFDIMEAINNHPLGRRPTNTRSRLAYSEIMNNIKPTKKYLLPGQIVCFEYLEPKYKEELEYYDRTPLVLFLGITRTEDGNIREIGLNLHYFPPFTRARILKRTYEAFKPHWQKFFNEPSKKPAPMIDYATLKHIMKTNDKIAFGIKMYIPVLRSNSYLIPMKMVPTAFYTEGHFSKATLGQIFAFWRKFK